MKQIFAVEVDVPDGYKVIAYRCPQNGDLFLKQDKNAVVVAYSDWHVIPANNRFILCRAFVWPSWLKCAAIAMDPSGEWYAHSETPMRASNGWHTTAASTRGHIHSELFDISFFPDVPWDQSLRINPNCKAE